MVTEKNSLLWGRIACLAGTAAALYLVFHRLNLHALGQALRTMRPGWFLAALVLYGLLFLPAAWRWHIVLRLMKLSAGIGATARLTLIGHFFYTVFFGVAGGDAAKAALYARWHRKPLPGLLATAPLDRLLGLAGLLGFTAMAFIIAGMTDGLERVKWISIKSPGGWALAVLAAALIIFWLIRRSAPTSGQRRFVRALSEGAKVLAASPRLAAQGMLCGWLVQLALSGVLALNLRAVTHEPLPWEQMLWTFPLIVVMSGLPISVAGLGTRDGAAMTLWGLYAVSAPDAVAASLLTVMVGLFWAFAGAILFWRERRLQDALLPAPKTVSRSVLTRAFRNFSRPFDFARVADVPETRVRPEQ